MAEFLELMLKPFLACLVLTGIHAYLGLHVIDRGVIFVDLALAQTAAFGATVGFLFGFGLHTPECYFTSLAFTMAGAGVLAATRLRRSPVPQEAFIGIVYAVAAAAAVLVLSRSAEGDEELKGLMVGHLLFVDWPELAKVSVLYAGIGFVHWLARGPFLLISRDVEAAYRRGLMVRWWDFLFYATFGLVVTSSVELGGVLLVFSFLIVPAVCGVLLARTTGGRLIAGWAVGAATSIAGAAASYWWDLPTGATVVCAFGVTLLIVAAFRAVLRGA